MDLKLKRPQGIGRWLQIYQLYMEAFPASERKPFGMIRRMYRKGTTDIWCLERSGSFAGMDTMAMAWKALRCVLWEAALTVAAILSINSIAAFVFDFRGEFRNKKRRK